MSESSEPATTQSATPPSSSPTPSSPPSTPPQSKKTIWIVLAAVALLLAVIGVAMLAARSTPTAPLSTPVIEITLAPAGAESTLVPTMAPPTPAATDAPVAPTAAPSAAPTVDAATAWEGARQFVSPALNFTVTFTSDGNLALTVPLYNAPGQAATWTGTWQRDGAGAVITLTQQADGKPLSSQPSFSLALVDGRPAVTAFSVGGTVLYDRAEMDFTLGAGERSPLVEVLNQLLASVSYLNYTAPKKDADLYSQNVVRAVARFQAAEGLVPSGVATPETWLALLSERRASLPASAVKYTPTGDYANVRSGPSLDYPVIAHQYKGETTNVIGKASGPTRDTTWLQICCIGTIQGWVRNDTGVVVGNRSSVPEVPQDQIPPLPTPMPTATPVQGQTASTAPQPAPLLSNLPSFTPEGKPVVYLTFDDGPNGQYTPQMLELLQQYGARTTFFMVGQQVGPQTEVVRRTVSAGHYAGNHTWDHMELQGISQEQFMAEVASTEQAIVQAAGDLFTLDKDVAYLRPPYGATDANTRQYAADAGYAVVLWDIDPQDWRMPGTDAIVSEVMNNVFPGAIVLMHDGGGDRSQSVAALGQILQQLSAKGYAFYTIFGK